MLNLNSVMIGTMNPKAMEEFYEKLFQKKPDMKDDYGCGWQVGSCFFGFGHHSKMEGQTKDPGRIMCNLETTEVKEEFDRIKQFATVIKEVYELEGMWIATFADPDGNYFQLMSPWEGK